MTYDLLVVGGGAAGFFTAIQYAENHPGNTVVILEASSKLLSKVAISGGGRCNVTHACFDPKEMVSYYPRGDKELLGPFHKFLCAAVRIKVPDGNCIQCLMFVITAYFRGRIIKDDDIAFHIRSNDTINCAENQVF